MLSSARALKVKERRVKASTKYRYLNIIKKRTKQLWSTLRLLMIVGSGILLFRAAHSSGSDWLKVLIVPIIVVELALLFPRTCRDIVLLLIYRDYRRLSRPATPEERAAAEELVQRCQEAQDSFRKKEYDRVVALLEPVKKTLSPALREKLKYARKKTRPIVHPNLP